MAKRKCKSGSGEGQYSITQYNLDNKGKTNKKLKRNPMAMKHLTARGKELKEAGEAAYKENMAKHRERMKQAS
jgi:hypothetical protein